MSSELRARCRGAAPLTARLEPWQLRLLSGPEEVGELLRVHGSPLNLIHPAPIQRNADSLRRAAADFGLDLRIYLARKANKALSVVDEAKRIGLGIDLASERELAQALERGVSGKRMVMTAAVKPAALLRLCISSGTTVVLDNVDELELLAELATGADGPAPVALRLAPELGPGRAQTRFGFGLAEALATVEDHPSMGPGSRLAIEGVHFHLDGYAVADRVTAIEQAVALIDALRKQGHEPTFVDIGGGVPVSYLDSEAEWTEFWRRHRDALRGLAEPVTFDGHGLGLVEHAGEVIGEPAVYPFHQAPVGGEWLSAVLAAPTTMAGSAPRVADALRERDLQLRCEPGRALLDGCGMTAARVSHRKQRRDGTWLIGVEMNRTQCRSTSDDFMVDPLLLRPDPSEVERETGPIEGYLVGAYCIERELLSWRRMVFPDGVRPGDIVVFPNTAGYLMHILESSSHQIPLARNVVIGGDVPVLDPIDGGAAE